VVAARRSIRVSQWSVQTRRGFTLHSAVDPRLVVAPDTEPWFDRPATAQEPADDLPHRADREPQRERDDEDAQLAAQARVVAGVGQDLYPRETTGEPSSGTKKCTTRSNQA